MTGLSRRKLKTRAASVFVSIFYAGFCADMFTRTYKLGD